MTGKKIITVFGATGAQGGAVADTFLNDPKLKDNWTVRAVTRDVTKDSAKKLESKGAEVVAADLNDKASVAKVLAGSYAVFAVTNYWEKLDRDLEVKQGKDIVDAAKETGVQHFIWSSLLNINKLSNGKFANVYHFDSKADVEEYAREVGIPSTFFLPGFYLSNVPDSFRPSPPNNAWTLSFPVTINATIPIFDTADTGKYVKAIVLNRDKLLGKRIYGATEYTSPAQLIEDFKKLFPEAGKTATYYQLPAETFKNYLKSVGMPDFAALELYENFQLFDEFGYYGGASLDETHALVEDKLTTWTDFIKKSTKFPADLK
ncbi:NmrA-like family-domain-containing protein [Lasiosphaeria ovina]|uniref:NmrA-like family domain-containing protein 1 n=1 Tax=Lasiosphaeria ovina TaxID=92902 RepID=A0AAE0KHA5_9PEZI|nr:NmrA-like family-domain-containing protein [Lasiosphaeria ovina]